jgi:hypothetical protein
LKIKPERLKFIIIAFLIASTILTIGPIFLKWGTLDVETKIGPASASLEADFYEHSVNYVITGNMSSDSGGIIGGIGGGITEGVTVDIRDNKTFLTGLGEFQENIGLILNSHKDKRYSISTSIQNIQTGEFEDTVIWITTHIDLIPWWPEGIDQSCSVEVRLIEPGNIQNIVVDEIKILLWRELDFGKQVYSESSKPLAKTFPNDKLSKVNESKEYDFNVAIGGDYGQVGIIGVVELTIIDSNGIEVPTNTIINLGKSDPMPAGRSNNINTMSQGEAAGVVLMVLAFPLSIISGIFIVIAIPFVFYRHRISTGIIITALILNVLAFIFFINGIETLIGLLDSVLETPVRENFTWSGIIALPIIGIGLLIPGYILARMVRLPSTKKVGKKDKKKGKGKKKPKKEDEPLPTFEILDKPESEPPEQIETLDPPQPTTKRSPKKPRKKGSRKSNRIKN